jgi:hypothetical protein
MNRQELEGYRFEYAAQQDAIERNARTGFDPIAARLQDKAQINNQKGIETMATGQLRIEKSNGASDPTPAALPQFTINVLVDGFPVKIEASGRAEHLVAMIAKLKQSGATPPAWASATQPRSVDVPEDVAPICDVHGTKMGKSQYNDGYFCGACSKERKQQKQRQRW